MITIRRLKEILLFATFISGKRLYIARRQNHAPPIGRLTSRHYVKIKTTRGEKGWLLFPGTSKKNYLVYTPGWA